MNAEHPNEPAERGIPQVGRPRKANRWIWIVLVALGIVLVLALTARAMLGVLAHRTHTRHVATLTPNVPDLARTAFDKPTPPPAAAGSSAMASPVAGVAPAQTLTPAQKAAADLAARRQRAPLLAVGGTGFARQDQGNGATTPRADGMPGFAGSLQGNSAPESQSIATRGEGATAGGTAARVAAGDGRLEVVGLESAEPDWSVPAMRSLSGKAYRLRVVGSIAITAAYVAAGRFDAFLSLRPCRSVDAAAAQLIVREAGGAVGFGGGPLEAAPLDLSVRYPMVAARDEEALAIVRAAQSA